LKLNRDKLCEDAPVKLDEIDRLFLEYFNSTKEFTLRVRINHFAKRVTDVIVSVIALVFFFPFVTIAAIATYFESGLPVFFFQKRYGYQGRKFIIYKMRTMHQDTDKRLHEFILNTGSKYLFVPEDADCYTKTGRYIEKFWLVEVPQFVNVLKGEMSIVGNRPVPDYVVANLGDERGVLERYASPPGISGITQIKGRENLNDEQRIEMECHYSDIYENGDVFIQDLTIILSTLLIYGQKIFSK
jgi:lipopolysaccharide/colanic/teichoic acid biosynthesis glycosyltransferase